MSVLVSGSIVAVPLGAALAGTAIALAGATVVVTSGMVVAVGAARGVIWTGKQLVCACEEHAATRRASYLAAHAYEESLKFRMEEISTERTEKLIAETMADNLARKQTNEAYLKILQVPQPSREPQMTYVLVDALEPEYPKLPRVLTEGELQRRANELLKQYQSCRAVYQDFANGEWKGLFNLENVGAVMRDLEQRIGAKELFLDYTQVNLTELEGALTPVCHRLREMIRESPTRWQERQQAIRSLTEADTILAALSQDLKRHPELSAGMQIAREAWRLGHSQLQRFQFAAAKQSAENTLEMARELADVPRAARRANVEVLLDRLDQYVASSGADTPVNAVRVQIQIARAWVEKKDFDKAWQGAEKAHQACEDLMRETLTHLQEKQQAQLVQSSRDVLAQMGYRVGQVVTSEEKTATFVGFKGEREFHVIVPRDSGEIKMKLEKFGDNSCKAEAREFLKRLRNQNVQIGETKSEDLLHTRLKTVHEALAKAGYKQIYTDPMDGGGGVNLMYERAKGSYEKIASVDYDGKAKEWSSSLPTDLAKESEDLIQQRTRMYELTAQKLRVGED